MDEHANTGERLGLGQLLFAGLGAAATGVDALDELADDVARRLGVDRGKMREAVRDTASSWRGEAEQVGGRRDEVVDRLLERLGVVRRSEMDDLALRVAQLEHRIRLLERDTP